MRRQRANRVSDGGVAGHEKCLAAAPTEILRLARARPTRFGHPGVTAEARERLRVLPDPLERPVSHVLEFERRDPPRGVTRPYLAGVAHCYVCPRPAAHTRLVILLMVVGQHPHDLEPGPE